MYRNLRNTFFTTPIIFVLLAVSLFNQHRENLGCNDEILELRFYRKFETEYYFGEMGHGDILYYKTNELEKFSRFNEGDYLLVCAESRKDINPPQEFMYGIKDYFALITEEIGDVMFVIPHPRY